MRRVLAVIAAPTLCACTLLVGTTDLASGGADASVASPVSDALAPDAPPADGSSAPLGASCRAIHELRPEAKSGSYAIAGDGGATVQATCDMETYGGGWTLVTPAMILEDRTAQEYSPGTPARVDVARSTDARGGAVFDLRVTKVNCGADGMQVGPGHYFVVGELDGWTQIMATYAFTSSSSCWRMFGDPELHDTNVFPFDVGRDRIGPQQNMARASSGTSIPYDGRTTACDEDPTNFWGAPYATQPKSARVVLRRFTQSKPAGLALSLDCGLAGWTVSDIHVR